MALKIRDKWRQGGKAVSLADNASAAAYASWQIALTATKNLHAQDFEYQNDHQRICVLREYLIFLSHIADRLAFEYMEVSDRKHFVNIFVTESARQLQRNAEEILGAGNYRNELIELLIRRNQQYNQYPTKDGAPGYGMLRSFGENVQQWMGKSQKNRWAIEQVIEIDGPNAVNTLKQTIVRLLESAKDNNSGVVTRETTR